MRFIAFRGIVTIALAFFYSGLMLAAYQGLHFAGFLVVAAFIMLAAGGSVVLVWSVRS